MERQKQERKHAQGVEVQEARACSMQHSTPTQMFNKKKGGEKEERNKVKGGGGADCQSQHARARQRERERERESRSRRTRGRTWGG
eukprot:30994-Rhodomonas_salina.2